jgi:transposase
VKAPVEVIPDAPQERLWDRVAAIDVAKATGMVCLRIPSEGDAARRVSKVWTVPALMGEVIALADHLVCQRVQQVAMEATSDYWRTFFYVFEAAGLNVVLVNARDVKNVPSRAKTDKLDAVWLAKLTERGMLRASFVPPAPIRVLRDYTRLRTDLIHERTRYWQRMEKLLEDALIKISSVASKLTTVSTKDMIRALIAGERSPQRLADLARGRMRSKVPQLVEALNGRFDEHHAEIAQILLAQIERLDAQIEELTTQLDGLIAQIPDAWGIDAEGVTGPEAGHGEDRVAAPALDRLAEIPGVSRDTAQTIIAEVGLDMSRFPTPGHLVSWAKLSPRTIQSGTRSHGGRSGKGNPYLKGTLGQAAAAAARTDTFMGHRFQRLVKRMGQRKAYVAVARSILIAVWHVLADPATSFNDLGPDHYTNRTKTAGQVRNHIRHLKALGYDVTITPAA